LDDKQLVKAVFDLGQLLGKGIEMQFKTLIPLSASFSSKVGYSKENDLINSNIMLNWFSQLKEKLEQFNLSASNSFQEIENLMKDTKDKKISTDRALDFGSSLDKWSTEISYSLVGRTAILPPPTCPTWFGIGFFSQYLLCKMELFPIVSQMTGIKADVLQFPKDTLSKLIGMEAALSSYIDRSLEKRIRGLQLPSDVKIIKDFIKIVEKVLTPVERDTLTSPKTSKTKLVLRGLLKGIPYLGPAIDAAIFGKE
jgi:hypothetical protein